MQVLFDPLIREEAPRGCVVSIGNFDGVHLGHQAVLKHLVSRARSLHTAAAVMTFEPHPAKLLRPSEAPLLVSTLEQRLQLIERTGIDVTMVVGFTHQFSEISAERFITEVLVDRLEVQEVYIGKNFRFGADRGGDVELLVRRGEELGFVAASAPTVMVDDEVVSSSRVRAQLSAGALESSWRLLGRPVFVDGEVFVGERLGRKLGFPTLNIAVENELYPPKGVYITAVDIPSFARVFPSVTNIGVRPTVYENYATTVESHLLDFTADVYRERVRLFFFARIREEKTFASPIQLMAQIRKDVETARGWFSDRSLSQLQLPRLSPGGRRTFG